MCSCISLYMQMSVYFASRLSVHTNSANTFWYRECSYSARYAAMHGIYHDIILHLKYIKKINSNILLKSVLSFKSQYVREIKTMACAYFCTK